MVMKSRADIVQRQTALHRNASSTLGKEPEESSYIRVIIASMIYPRPWTYNGR